MEETESQKQERLAKLAAADKEYYEANKAKEEESKDDAP